MREKVGRQLILFDIQNFKISNIMTNGNVEINEKEQLEIAHAEAQLLMPNKSDLPVDIFDEELAEKQTKKLLKLFAKNKKRGLKTTVPDSANSGK